MWLLTSCALDPCLCVAQRKQNKPSNNQEYKTTINLTEDNRKKQCKPNETKPCTIHPCVCVEQHLFYVTKLWYLPQPTTG